MANPRIITYSKSSTLILTTYCSNNCRYCGFRNDSGTLIENHEIESILAKAKSVSRWEILVMSGERPENLPEIRKELASRGYKSFADFAYDVCRKILNAGMLPHTNIGILRFDELLELREVNASMGLMLENIDEKFGGKVHPKKNIKDRIRMIEEAGRLKIPFTTGILIGLGETGEERSRSVDAILELHSKYGHIQEIILQNFVPNRNSDIRDACPVKPNEYFKLIEHIKESSDITVQIPQNLNPDFLYLLSKGAGDLGGISEESDHINPEKPWREINLLEEETEKAGLRLVPRLPIYEKYVKLKWYSSSVEPVLKKYMTLPAFSYYSS